MTIVETPTSVLVIRRVPGGPAIERPASVTGDFSAEALLTGTWSGVSEPHALVRVSSR